jgi:hypothetical protein
MKKILPILAIAALCAAPAFAADAEYTFREGVRTGVVTSLFSVAVSAPGNLAVATNVTVGGNATIAGSTIVNHIDTTGPADIDVGSADVTDVTVTTDGGTVILDGVGTVSDDVTCDKLILTDAATAAPTNEATQGLLVVVNGTNYWIGLSLPND